ncbi:hypothetical protein [uncultured Ilumatobacter sp.]|uniref:hypothetical protein n=1 Tax=uncultured Ilumatobacter sp. TaxID=879968 RepID=UPI00374FADED
MGFFRKKTDTPDQLEVLRLEIVSLRKQLDDADQQKAQLLARVETVDETSTALRGRVESADQINAVLHQRVDALDSANAQLGQRVGSVDGAVVRVRDDVAAVNQQLESANTLGAEVQALTERLNSTPVLPPLRAALPPPDGRVEELLRQVAALSDTVTAQGKTPVVDPAEISALAQRLDAMSADLTARKEQVDDAGAKAGSTPNKTAVAPEDVEVMRTEITEMAESMAALDRRITNVSMELANQLTELSNDLEVLLLSADNKADDGDEAAVVGLAIEAVQQSTERLAIEQARYQIQFRQDLAELAERLRRPAR